MDGCNSFITYKPVLGIISFFTGRNINFSTFKMSNVGIYKQIFTGKAK